MTNTLFIIAVVAGILIGALIASIPLIRRYREDERIIILLRRGLITHNEAREWRDTNKPPSRLTSGALSPYGDD